MGVFARRYRVATFRRLLLAGRAGEENRRGAERAYECAMKRYRGRKIYLPAVISGTDLKIADYVWDENDDVGNNPPARESRGRCTPRDSEGTDNPQQVVRRTAQVRSNNRNRPGVARKGKARSGCPGLPANKFVKPEAIITKPDPKRHWSKYKQATLTELVLDFVRRHAELIPVPQLAQVAVRWRRPPHIKDIREAVRTLVTAGAIRISDRADAVQRI